ncbi:MAG TPA: hypothetical protein VKH18_12015 [Terriglobales bacterium]|nr:hypothetical protein [Terriglobales bacterium]
MRRLIRYDEDEMNRILSSEDEILPSSGFAVSVMDAVRREAAAPPPIPFPWKRALPGLVVAGLAVGLVLVAGIVAIAQLGRASKTTWFPTSWSLSSFLPSVTPPILHGGMESAAIWVAMALLLAFVSVKLSMRMASGRG